MLSVLNPHERDMHISFEEGPHIYTIDGDSNYMSVTTWNGSHFPKFDSDSIIERILKKNHEVGSKYYGMSGDDIKKQWEDNGKLQAEAGTKLHFDIECYYNNNPNENNSLEYQYFMNFVKDYPNLVPYRTEWMIWDKDLRFAGSIDMIFKNDDGTISIYDWKRCKEISSNSRYNQFAITECIEHLPDSKVWHYSLQLYTYKAILEKSYGMKVKECFIVCFHPNKSNYQLIKAKNMTKEVEDLFNLRIKLLKDT